MSDVGYLKVCREVGGILQVGYMPLAGTEVYLSEPSGEVPDPHQAHYTYANKDLAWIDGWAPVIKAGLEPSSDPL